MTQTDTHATTCPQCAGTSSVPMSDGTRLCLNCRHEWNPGAVNRGAPQPVASTASAPVDGGPGVMGDTAGPPSLLDTIDAPSFTLVPPIDDVETDDTAAEVARILRKPLEVVEAEQAQATLDALIGTEVVMEGGQRATIVAFPDDDHVTVDTIGDGDGDNFVTVDFNDVERATTPVVPVVELPDDKAQALAATLAAVAGLVINAGLQTIVGDGPDARIVDPPIGFFPDDPEVFPTIEQGCAYAIAIIVNAFNIDRDILSAVATTLLADAETQQPTKGGTEQ